MRKLMDFVLLWCLFCGAAFGQATNPQNTFSNAVNAAMPSLWLNFNDPTAVFKDVISQGSFTRTSTIANPGGQAFAGYFGTTNDVTYTAVPLASDFTLLAWVYFPSVTGLSSGNRTFFGGTAYTNFYGGAYRLWNGSADVAVGPAVPAGVWTLLTVTRSGSTVDLYYNTTLEATGSWSGTFTPTKIGSGAANVPMVLSNVSIYNAALTSTQIGTIYGGGSVTSGLIDQWYLNEGSGSTAVNSVTANNGTWVGTPGGSYGYYDGPFTFTSGTITPQQPGFDSTNPSNYSAEFPYNGFISAPNNTLGDIEWNIPWTMLLHVDRLNWDRTTPLVLASKGDVQGCTASTSCSANGSWWKLFLQQNTTNASASQLCFERNGMGESAAQQLSCTGTGYDAMPNGFNYDIVVEDSGTGQASAVSMWMNGLPVGASIPSYIFSNSYAQGFGNVKWTVTTGGTGYAASTPFTSTGGGANCVVTGTAYATSGVITAAYSNAGNTNAGCTSAPTIVLTAPTGTGANITANVLPMSMNSTTEPLMVPGYVSNGVVYGVGGTDATQNPVNLDEFAIFPGNLTSSQIGNLFYTTKFYQSLINTATPKPVMVLDEDGFGDSDDVFMVQMGIGMHRAGIVTLAGLVSEDGLGSVAAAWRQMLDSAGLNDVPVSTPVPNMATNTDPTALVTAYNASTPQTIGSYENSTTMYRTIFARYPTTPIIIMMGGPNWQDMAQFMQSPADSISPLTGLQMIAQNGANGGAIYGQGALRDTSANGDYVVTHNQSMPIIWIAGVPMNAGPGPLATRTSNDILWKWFNFTGTDIRQCYDCLLPEAAVSSLFDFGVTVSYSGGTGYANATPFTLSGGGPHCQGSGIMTAASGVPNGIEFSWGKSASGLTIGSGCTSQPTLNLIGATGTGVTLTAAPSLCGTMVPTLSGTTYSYAFSTATCSNQYNPPGSFNTYQTPYSGTVMSWFINSLVDGSVVGAPRVP